MKIRDRKSTLAGAFTLSLLALPLLVLPVIAETRYVPTLYLEHADGRKETLIIPEMEEGETLYDCRKQIRIWSRTEKSGFLRKGNFEILNIQCERRRDWWNTQ